MNNQPESFAQRRSFEEVMGRAKDIYERIIQPTLTKDDIGKLLAIDIETETYELGSWSDNPRWRLMERCAGRPGFLMRVGYPAADKLGGSWPAGAGQSLNWFVTQPKPSMPLMAHENRGAVDGLSHSPEEFGRRGDEIYLRVIKPTLCKADIGKFIAIDIETENFEVDVDERAAHDRLRSRCPDAQMWVIRAGYPAAHKMCGSWPLGTGETL